MTDLGRALRARLAPTFTIDVARRSSRARRRPTARRSSCCASPTAGTSRRSTSRTRPRRRSASRRRSAARWRARSASPARWDSTRHLTAGEIAGQVRVARARDRPRRHAVQHRADGHGRAAAQLRRDDEGAADPGRRAGTRRASAAVTLSTVGVAAGARAARRRAADAEPRDLAARDDRRAARAARADQPQVRLEELHRRVPAVSARARSGRITFEYVLLAGVNDTPDDARRLVRLLSGIKAKVNLLPLNEAPGIPFTRPSDERVNAFAQILADRGRDACRCERAAAATSAPRAASSSSKASARRRRRGSRATGNRTSSEARSRSEARAAPSGRCQARAQFLRRRFDLLFELLLVGDEPRRERRDRPARSSAPRARRRWSRRACRSPRSRPARPAASARSTAARPGPSAPTNRSARR